MTKRAKIAHKTGAGKIKLNRIDGFFKDYFKSVFARAMKTCQIVDANYKARKIFNPDNLEPIPLGINTSSSF